MPFSSTETKMMPETHPCGHQHLPAWPLLSSHIRSAHFGQLLLLCSLCFRKIGMGAVLLSVGLTACIQSEDADLIVHNATIHSMDEGMNTAQAMAVKDGKIIALGAEREILNRYRAQSKYDARKMHVYPGFIDAHAHFIGYARNLAELDLKGVGSEEEMLERLAAFAASSEREWIVGRGWDQNLWERGQYPHRSRIDSILPDRPVLLTRIDGHAAVINTAAMKKAALNPDRPIAGGKMLRDADGAFSGMLIDRAVDRISRFIPPLDPGELVPMLKQAQAECFALGLTSVSDLGIGLGEALLLDSLQQQGELDIRIYASLRPEESSLDFMHRGPLITERLSLRSVKMYADGALGSRGALLKQPYSDDPENYGLLLTALEEIHAWAEACMDFGFQLNTHCIGDSAAALVLALYADQLREMNDLRWRIEHAQVLSPGDRHYFGDYGIIPSVQPVHAVSDAPWAEERLGPDRIAHAYAYASLKQELGILALGTDFPVEAISPLDNLHAAVFRLPANREDAAVFHSDEALSMDDALRGMTIWAALAQHEEEVKGSLEAGKFADFAIYNRNISETGPAEWHKLKCTATFVDGMQVYPLGN